MISTFQKAASNVSAVLIMKSERWKTTAASTVAGDTLPLRLSAHKSHYTCGTSRAIAFVIFNYIVLVSGFILPLPPPEIPPFPATKHAESKLMYHNSCKRHSDNIPALLSFLVAAIVIGDWCKRGSTNKLSRGPFRLNGGRENWRRARVSAFGKVPSPCQPSSRRNGFKTF